MTPVFCGFCGDRFFFFFFKNESSQRGKEPTGGVVVAAAFSERLTKICRTPNTMV